MGGLALVLIVVWVVVVAALRGYLLSRRTGDIGVHARDPAGSAQWWSKLISVVAVLSGITAAVADLLGLPALPGLESSAVVGAGVVLVILGTTGTVVAQLAMGESWRGDVDPDARTELVTTGPYRYVRNPILAATFVTVLGIALVVPNAFALLFLLGVVASMQIQVRLVEEPYLDRVHGDAWRRYAAATGRFVPGIGRLSSPHAA